MDLRLSLSLTSGKLVKQLSRTSGSGGTAAPGLAAQKIDPQIFAKLASQLEKVILVTGTNGKTTTSRIIGNCLEANQIKFLHNREGSNLERGLISVLLGDVNLQGNLKTKVGIFETDEAALGGIVKKLSPDVIVVNNLFRDQLDRYGEVDNIKRLWLSVFANLDERTTLVLNCDDPSVAFLGQNTRCKVLYFGLDDPKVKLESPPLAVDSVKCPSCFTDLKYEVYYLSHQGNYACPNCSFKRPKPDVAATEISFEKTQTDFTLVDGTNLSLDLVTKLPGLYNVYNCLSAYCAIKAGGYEVDSFALSLKKFQPVFGRGEFLEHQNRKIRLALAKNPSGFNEILRTFLADFEGTAILAINDLIADGRDVSWLWDVEFEKLADKPIRFVCSGIRGTDMALRLKYAGIREFQVVENLGEAVTTGLDQIPSNDTLLIIPTYTAMLQLKKIFAAKSVGGEFWED